MENVKLQINESDEGLNQLEIRRGGKKVGMYIREKDSIALNKLLSENEVEQKGKRKIPVKEEYTDPRRTVKIRLNPHTNKEDIPIEFKCHIDHFKYGMLYVYRIASDSYHVIPKEAVATINCIELEPKRFQKPNEEDIEVIKKQEEEEEDE